MHETDRESHSKREAVSFIADMAHELASLAAGHHLHLLRYLLEMARDEARHLRSVRHEEADVDPQ